MPETQDGEQLDGSADQAAETAETFDFDTHGREAAEKNRLVQGSYADCAAAVHDLLAKSLTQEAIQVSSLEHRAKTLASFAEKASRPKESDPEKPEYPNPMDDIRDMAGVRVITF